jgi:glycosyltransferase involved in cell wall biosynthesis
MPPFDCSMRVVFDSQVFCAQQFGGISRYFASLAGAMHAAGRVKPLILAPLHVNAYLERLPPSLVLGRRVGAGRTLKALARSVSFVASEAMQFVRRPDIAHHTYYYPWPQRGRPVRNVITVYDMIHEKYPRDFSRSDPMRRWKKAAVAAADHVICISENTRRDLLELHCVPPGKVSVTHLGYDDLSLLLGSEPPEQWRARRLGCDRPYLLYVGSRTGYKNFSGLLAAYAGSPWLRANFALLCFGGGPFSVVEHVSFARYGVTHLMHHAGGADEELAACYRHAALLVYPSLYEGFGIPPLEAMSLDCPVACSGTSSLPEVVGDGAAIFDPHDIGAMRAAIESALEPAARTELVARGRLRRECFSWERCAEETEKIYERIA